MPPSAAAAAGGGLRRPSAGQRAQRGAKPSGRWDGSGLLPQAGFNLSLS